MYKIIIFGTGLYGKQALQFFTRENVMFWTDNKEDLHGKLIEGIEVIPPSELKKYLNECVIVIAGKPVEEIREEEIRAWEEMPIEEHMEHYLSQGMDKKEAMKAVAKDRGISKRDVYQQLL